MKFKIAEKGNRQTKLLTVKASRDSCPPCALMDECYPAQGYQGYHWDKVEENGMALDELDKGLRYLLNPNEDWRYADAGDMPPVRDNRNRIDVDKAYVILKHGRPFLYSHYPVSRYRPKAVKTSAMQRLMWKSLTADDCKWNRDGIRFLMDSTQAVINLSADNLRHADILADLKLAPVVVVLPKGTRQQLYTPKGRLVVVCPSKLQGLGKFTCRQCGGMGERPLCSRRERVEIWGFPAHGVKWKEVNQIAKDEA